MLLKEQMMQQAYGPNILTYTAVESNMRDLEAWHRALPPSMSLASLMAGTSHDLNPSEQGALFLAHALYLGSIVMLHRPILVAMSDARISGEWRFPDLTPSQAQKHHERCVGAARSLARIFILLKFGTQDTNMNVRCWLCIFEIFTSCTVLLYDMAVRFLTHTVNDTTLVEDLDRVGACMEMLRVSGEVDTIAEKIYRTLLTQHQAIRKLHNDATSVSRDGREGDGEGGLEHANQFVLDRLQGKGSPQEVSGSMQVNGSGSGKVSEDGIAKMDRKSCSCVVAVELVQQGADILRNPFGHGGGEMDRMVCRNAGTSCADWWESAYL
jgi:hypothetical protein